MSQTPHSPAVKLARAHVEAWGRKDFDTARNALAPDVTATQSSTMPGIPRADLVGADDYMHGLILFAQSIVPGSVRVTDSGRLPSPTSLRVVLSIAAMWSASKACRMPSV